MNPGLQELKPLLDNHIKITLFKIQRLEKKLIRIKANPEYCRECEKYILKKINRLHRNISGLNEILDYDAEL